MAIDIIRSSSIRLDEAFRMPAPTTRKKDLLFVQSTLLGLTTIAKFPAPLTMDVCGEELERKLLDS